MIFMVTKERSTVINSYSEITPVGTPVSEYFCWIYKGIPTTPSSTLAQLKQVLILQS